MKKKKIFCLIESLSPGGAERQMVGLARLLKEGGYTVKVATYYDIPFYKSYLDEKGVSYEFISKAKKPLNRIWYIHKAIKEFAPDVVIAYLNTPCIIASICKLLYGNFNLIVSERNTTQVLTKKERIKFFLYRWADVIVSNSSSQTKYIGANFPYLKEKTYTITNFVDTCYFSPLNDKKEETKVCEIICVGRIEPQKNILNFIEAIHHVIENGYHVNVKWFGRKNEVYYTQCYKKIKEYNIQKAFTFYNPSSQIKEQYHKADLLCLPSIFEGFPNVICEAMSCGLPILCSDVCDNPTIVDNEINGFLFNPDDPMKISNAIALFINLSTEDKHVMGLENRKKALNMFSSTTFIQQYIKLIDALQWSY